MLQSRILMFQEDDSFCIFGARLDKHTNDLKLQCSDLAYVILIYATLPHPDLMSFIDQIAERLTSTLGTLTPSPKAFRQQSVNL